MAHLWYVVCSCGWTATAYTREEGGRLVDTHQAQVWNGWHYVSLKGELFPARPRPE